MRFFVLNTFWIFCSSAALAQAPAGQTIQIPNAVANIMIKEIGKEGFVPRTEIRGTCQMGSSATKTFSPCQSTELLLLGPAGKKYLSKVDLKGSFAFTGLVKGTYNLAMKSSQFRIDRPLRNLLPGLGYTISIESKKN